MSVQITQKILIVDDKPENLESLEALLSETGAVIIRALNGRDALSILLKEDISLVLLDVQMPEMDGFEVASLMHSKKKTSLVPIIFITAIITDEHHILQGYTAGAIDYIVKPILPSVLLNKVKIFLDLDRHKRELELMMLEIERQKGYFESILNAAGDGVIGLSQDGVVEFCNPASLSLLDFSRDFLIGKTIFDIWKDLSNKEIDYQKTVFFKALDEQKTFNFDECVFFTRNGHPLQVSMSCSPLATEERGTVVVFQDITARKALEEKLIEQAKTDALTGLANRTMFVQTLRQSIARASRMNKLLAVLFLDLDQFKQINDTMGHDSGDLLLMMVSQRIMHAVRSNDTVARLGGDEFTILLEDIGHEEDAARVAEKILTSLREPFILDAQELIMGVSIGIATYPVCGDSASGLMQAADVAMYRVKTYGRNSYQYFTPEMNKDAQERLDIEQELRQALNNNSMELYYQPQISIQTGELIGVEALLRWNRSKNEQVAPASFISILEETGLILPYGKWILWMACLQARNWYRAGILNDTSRMCVNVSARQFTSTDFYDSLMGVLEQTELSPTLLELEITESVLVSNSSNTQALLTKLRQEGIRISVDDFGTGYSSLSYLRQYPIDVIKIDRSFIADGLLNPRDVSLIKSIVDMGHALGFSVLMEGVEDKHTLEVLASLGMDAFQGYLCSRPLPAREFEFLIAGTEGQNRSGA